MANQAIKSIVRGLTPPVLMDFIWALRRPPQSVGGQFVQAQNLDRTAHGEFHYQDSASFRALYESYFERETYRFESANPKPYIIDGGANVGVSCRYWNYLYPEAEVVAFEPDEQIFDLLQKNMAGQSRFSAKRMALWSSDGTLTFNAVGGEGGHLETVSARDDVSVRKISVPTFRLRNLLDRKVQLLKLDIEGAELEVLRDCAELLNNVERLFVEHHSFLGQPQQLGEFFGILEAARFRVNVHVDTVAPQPFLCRTVYNRKDSWLNIFAFRS